MNMGCQLENLITRWLRSMKVPVSKAFLKRQLLSHPDYPSLASITDMLDELNIENWAFVIEKEKLREIPVPFLAHTKKRGGEFELITDIEKYLKDNPGFEKQWDGIAVLAEKPEHFKNSENEQLLQQEKRNSRMLWFFILFISGLSLFSVWNNFSWLYSVLLIATITGLSVAILIAKHELDIANEFIEQ